MWESCDLSFSGFGYEIGFSDCGVVVTSLASCFRYLLGSETWSTGSLGKVVAGFRLVLVAFWFGFGCCGAFDITYFLFSSIWAAN
jgi:hypothetical protein